MKRQQKQIWCKPGQELPKDVKHKLKRCVRGQNNEKYVSELCDIFGVDPPTLPPIDRDYRLVLAGFIAGEGSFNISARKNPPAKFGLVIAPQFSITQHVNGVSYLLGALKLFEVGGIAYKNQSNATIVFTVNDRESLN